MPRHRKKTSLQRPATSSLPSNAARWNLFFSLFLALFAGVGLGFLFHYLLKGRVDSSFDSNPTPSFEPPSSTSVFNSPPYSAFYQRDHYLMNGFFETLPDSDPISPTVKKKQTSIKRLKQEIIHRIKNLEITVDLRGFPKGGNTLRFIERMKKLLPNSANPRDIKKALDSNLKISVAHPNNPQLPDSKNGKAYFFPARNSMIIIFRPEDNNEMLRRTLCNEMYHAANFARNKEIAKDEGALTLLLQKQRPEAPVMNHDGVVDSNKYFKFREAYRAFDKRFTEIEKQLERNPNDGRLQKFIATFSGYQGDNVIFFFKKTEYLLLREAYPDFPCIKDGFYYWSDKQVYKIVHTVKNGKRIKLATHYYPYYGDPNDKTRGLRAFIYDTHSQIETLLSGQGYGFSFFAQDQDAIIDIYDEFFSYLTTLPRKMLRLIAPEFCDYMAEYRGRPRGRADNSLSASV
ncbi:hypothetical protein [Coxiella burnetii]|uniref:hypothetical protein n=1 Tax=Coxiella burnetii TaxID=777 RepID=UPI00051F1805|nr:hypothetical protein [Coxiella burnetii]AIT64120.1 hypothetical protein CBNA_1924 [Coxiella burnetii str. Namibia]